jgi:hypothetical protein
MRINWLAVIISAIIVVLLRRVWYAHFGGAEWGALPGQIIGDVRGDPTLAGKELVNGLVLSLALAWVLDAARSRSLPGGIGVGLAAAIGFGLTSISAGLIHGEPVQNFLIDGGYLLVAYAVAGAILGATAPRRSSREKFNWGGGGSQATAEH